MSFIASVVNRHGYWFAMYEKFYNAREKLSPMKVNPEAKAVLSDLWEAVVNPEQ